MISDIARTLETKGFKRRNKNPLDKREILLSPTEEGASLIKHQSWWLKLLDEALLTVMANGWGITYNFDTFQEACYLDMLWLNLWRDVA